MPRPHPRTLVVSDLHLGSGAGVDVLRRADLRAPLLTAVREADRVVLLGDTLEFRHTSVGNILREVEPFFCDLGQALGPGKEVWMTGGNHDWGLVSPWVEAIRARGGALGLSQFGDPADAGAVARQLGEWVAAGGATLRLAYPGMWLRDDVFAWHGHYGDLHTLVPTFERLWAGGLSRIVVKPGKAPRVEDYEAAVAPACAWMHQVAQHRPPAGGASASAAIWTTIRHRSRWDPRRLVVAAGARAAIGLVNRTPIGPVSADLGPTALRRGGLHGQRIAVADLVPTDRARHVVFGHTHRSGPWPEAGDDPSEWRTPDGHTTLTNTGSWTYGRMWLDGARPNENPYWPGTAVWIEETGPPRLVRLLGYRTHIDFMVGPEPAQQDAWVPDTAPA